MADDMGVTSQRFTSNSGKLAPFDAGSSPLLACLEALF